MQELILLLSLQKSVQAPGRSRLGDPARPRPRFLRGCRSPKASFVPRLNLSSRPVCSGGEPRGSPRRPHQQLPAGGLTHTHPGLHWQEQICPGEGMRSKVTTLIPCLCLESVVTSSQLTRRVSCCVCVCVGALLVSSGGTRPPAAAV